MIVFLSLFFLDVYMFLYFKNFVCNGAVIVKGAQGKKVVINNVLGQTVANTVITSSEATISVPAGVVFVAVEGEPAVKAIVK